MFRDIGREGKGREGRGGGEFRGLIIIVNFTHNLTTHITINSDLKLIS